MKNVILIIFVICLSSVFSFAGKYEKAMTSAIENLNKANSQEGYLEAASAFERIGAAEKSEWLPFYYASLGYIWTSHQTQDGATIDGYLDKAQVLLDEAGKLSPENGEIVTLQGYIYMMKVAVDPPTRGQEYSGKAMQEFGKAVGMNPNNPRALVLMGRMQMGVDQFFGNDLAESCGMINKAVMMFDDQKPKTAIEPVWGKEMAEIFVKECQPK